MKTYMAKKNEIEQKWYLIDAENKVLGRLASRIAIILRGKNKPEYTPNVDCGDGVIVINAGKIRVTGKKMKDKEYQTYSGYPGGRKSMSLEDMMKKKPAEVIRLAVKRMIADTPLGREMFRKLKVYTGAEHDNRAQNPEKIDL